MTSTRSGAWCHAVRMQLLRCSGNGAEVAVVVAVADPDASAEGPTTVTLQRGNLLIINALFDSR